MTKYFTSSHTFRGMTPSLAFKTIGKHLSNLDDTVTFNQSSWDSFLISISRSGHEKSAFDDGYEKGYAAGYEDGIDDND